MSDGRLVLAGDFRVVGNARRTFVSIIFPNGTVDHSFEAGEFTTNIPQAAANITRVAVQPDGKLLVAGSFTHIDGIAARNFARLNASGSLDTSFNIGQGANSTISKIMTLPDGKILLSGLFTTFAGTAVPPFIRLNSDGSRDTSFVTTLFYGLPQIDDFLIQPDGKMIVTGDLYSQSGNSQGIDRILANGAQDPSFDPGSGPGNYISSVALQFDGKILISGNFLTFNGTSRLAIARLNVDGSLDNGFVANSSSNTGFGAPVNFTPLPDGKTIVCGGFERINDVIVRRIARLNSDGNIDPTFSTLIDANNNEAGGVSSVTRLPDESMIISGSFYSINSAFNFGLAKIFADGATDSSFSLSAKERGVVYSVARQPDGKFLVGGSMIQIDGRFAAGISRLLPDGNVDTTFNAGTGLLKLTELIGGPRYGILYDIVLQPDGKILIGGDFGAVNNIGRGNLARLNADGSVDEAFAIATPFGVIYDIKVQSDGKIVTAGRNGVRRYNSNGSTDTQFNTGNISHEVRTVEIQTDGKLVIGGSFTNINNIPRNRIARLNPSGSLDSGYDTSVGANGIVLSSSIQPDGKVIFGGSFTTVNGTARNRVVRLNTDGTLDTLFNVGVAADSTVRKVLVLPGGKVMVGGAFNTFGGVSQRKLARLMPNGQLDAGFRDSLAWGASAAVENYVDEIAVDGSGLVVSGPFTNLNGRKVSGLVKLNTSGSPFDFDGDSMTDISIFRPGAGEWWYLRSSNGGNSALQFGGAQDILSPRDFTGDGKTDIAFWRQSDGFWYILRSEDSSFFSFPFGATGDIPVSADYDGDGKADPAVFRPSSGTWFISRSSDNGTSIINFGISEDRPLAADFDGDGKADIAVFRPSDGSWWYLKSSDGGSSVYRFGIGSDRPVPGDFTGDGKADIAVFRPSTGEWFVQRSEDDSFFSFPFGANGDLPVPGDYDGDGKTDAAVFRASTSTWFLNQTTAGIGIVGFGAPGDQPLPASNVP